MSDSDNPKGQRLAATEAPTGAAIPLSASRVDRLSEEFTRLLSQRPPEIGDVLGGRYRVTELLGVGGMGQVFVAENLAIGRRVAIKVLKVELLINASLRKRFQQEAEAIAAIEDQNVVRFLDLVVGDPTFLVMEYVRGPTLSAILKTEQRLEPFRAISIARRLAWGLDAAHRAGVVHRDVKPSNVILAPDHEAGEQPKLVDFGVAKVSAEASDEQLTLAGQVVGTPHYMSPEQITGSRVDARSDVYSLGCVLYHMLTGTPPFDDDEAASILSQHVHQAAAPLRKRMADVPAGLEAIVERALAKRPKERFATAEELARALELIVDPKKKSTPKEPRARKWRWLAALAAVAVVGAGAAAWRWMPAAAGGQLLVTTQPAGASIELDGKIQRGTTPLAIVGLAAGDHRITLRHGKERDEITRTVNLKADERVPLHFALPPRSHAVAIGTFPAGATLYLDGRLVRGVTPVSINLSDEDFHELRIELEGYDTIVKGLAPDDRAPSLEFTLQPEREPRGRLFVDADATAEIWVDGVSTGLFTPASDILLNPGAHTVELRDSTSAIRSTTNIRLAAHESRHLMMTIVRACVPSKEIPAK